MLASSGQTRSSPRCGIRGQLFIQTATAVRAKLQPSIKGEAAALEDLEALVRRTGLDVERVESRRENVDLVIEYDIRGPKRLHDQVMIAILHHPVVRTVSTGE